MKKIVAFIVMSFTCFALIACGGTDSIKEYTGPKLIKLTHTSIDYMGGYTVKDELDFIENKYSSLGYMPTEIENPELELKSTFTDEEEIVFMNECYSYGLFDIEESYSETGIVDGGGWTLIIEFEDGTTKTSRGHNAGPTIVFNKCAITFYDLCGKGIVGNVPEYYIYPPRISVGFKYEDGWDGGLSTFKRADYKWNKSESLGNDYFQLNESVKDRNKFDSNYSYKLVLYTANYDCDEKFNKITVKEYDYNSELSNEKTIYSSKWFYQIEFDITLNKIYVYELTFKDGDYVQYTFSTYCK